MDAAVWTMDSYDLLGWGLLPLTVGLVAILGGAAGLSTGQRTSELRSAHLFLVFTGLWLGSTGLVLASTDDAAALWWSRSLVLGMAAMTPLSLQGAEGIVPWAPVSRAGLAAFWLVCLVLVLTGLQTDAVVAGLHHHWFGPYPRWGPMGLLLVCYALLGSGLVLRAYVRELRASPPDSHRRTRARYILLASALGMLAYLDFLPGWGLPVPPVGFATVTLLMAVLLYSARRYHSYDLTGVASTHQALERMEDPLLLVERGGEIARANPAAARTFGVPLHAIAGQRVEHVTEGRVRAEHIAAVLERAGEGPQDVVLDENTGFPRYLAVSAAPMEDAAGHPIAAVLVFRDHTIREKYRTDLELHRLRLEETVARRTEELRETIARLQREMAQREQAERTRELSEARFHELADLLPEAVYEVDRDGRITYANRYTHEVTGYAPEELELGFAGTDLFVPEERQAAAEAMRGQLDSPDDVVREHTVLRKDGTTFPALLRSMPLIRDGEPVGVRGLLIDIGERKELELQLRQSQRLEAIGQLAGGVAHDFNNLLTVILGTSYFVRQALPEEGRARSDLTTLENAAQRASDLTRQLLAFSRKQVLERRRVQLNELVADLEQMLARLIGEDIAVELGLDPALPPLELDRAQIEQVLLNLAVNARDAMPRGGTLRITTARVTLHAGEDLDLFEPRAIPAGAYVCVTVEDTGIGMDARVRRHAFEPFFTTKGREAGTGLGLSTVYGIVRQHDGAVTVTSVPGEGTTFRIYLPAPEVLEAPASADPEVPDDLAGTERVLVVEDDGVVRDVVVRHLGQHGYRVRAAADAEQALAEGDAALARIDLLLTDVVMPGMDGRSLAERVQRVNPGVRVLFMSGYTDDRLQTHRVDAAEAPLLTKPFTQEQLLRQVRAVLAAAPSGARPA